MRDFSAQQRDDIIEQFLEGNSIEQICRINECRNAFGCRCAVEEVEAVLRDAVRQVPRAVLPELTAGEIWEQIKQAGRGNLNQEGPV